jgi:hypothetical protein
MHDDERKGPPAGEDCGRASAQCNQQRRHEDIVAHRAILEPLFSAGYELIPLHAPDAIDRRGRSVGKAPLKPKWRTLPALDLDEVAEHLAHGFNVGVRLRDTDLVVDVDPRHFAECDNPLARLARDFGLPDCPTVATGEGAPRDPLVVALEPIDLTPDLRQVLHRDPELGGLLLVHPDAARDWVAGDVQGAARVVEDGLQHPEAPVRRVATRGLRQPLVELSAHARRNRI